MGAKFIVYYRNGNIVAKQESNKIFPDAKRIKHWTAWQVRV